MSCQAIYNLHNTFAYVCSLINWFPDGTLRRSKGGRIVQRIIGAFPAFPDLGITSFSASLDCTARCPGRTVYGWRWSPKLGRVAVGKPSWLHQKLRKEIKESVRFFEPCGHVATAGSVFLSQISVYTWAFHLWCTTDQLYTPPSLLGGVRSDMVHLQ